MFYLRYMFQKMQNTTFCLLALPPFETINPLKYSFMPNSKLTKGAPHKNMVLSSFSLHILIFDVVGVGTFLMTVIDIPRRMLALVLRLEILGSRVNCLMVSLRRALCQVILLPGLLCSRRTLRSANVVKVPITL